MIAAFYKYEGLANDFILLEAFRAQQPPLSAEQAAALCDRRRGIGADGVLSLLKPETPGASFRMHIFNADGSVAEMCGNGLRCAVWHDTLRRPELPGLRRVDTGAGLLWGEVEAPEQVRLGMGPARLIEEDIPCAGVEGLGLGLSMGNPHLVLPMYPEGTDLMAEAERLGPALERHPHFPERTNVGFLCPEGEALRLVVYERGSGITLACGTGASAAAVAAWWRGALPGGRSEARVEVELRLPGGPLRLFLEPKTTAAEGQGAALAEVQMSGAARRVFKGSVELG